MSKTQEALKLALEALEDARTELCEWSSDVNREDYNNPRLNDAITAIREALAEQPAQQQEPLCTAAMFDDAFLAKSGLDPNTNLYTSPQPNKPWVGLTDEERGQVYANWRFNGSGSSNLELCRAIEAKLREKNA